MKDKDFWELFSVNCACEWDYFLKVSLSKKSHIDLHFPVMDDVDYYVELWLFLMKIFEKVVVHPEDRVWWMHYIKNENIDINLWFDVHYWSDNYHNYSFQLSYDDCDIWLILDQDELLHFSNAIIYINKLMLDYAKAEKNK